MSAIVQIQVQMLHKSLSKKQPLHPVIKHRSSFSSISGHYDVVLAGGGIIGTSVGYHLSKHSAGLKPLLLEQNSLTSGTTWHAASLLGTVRSTALETAITRYTALCLKEIESETGYSPSLKNCTSMQLACTPQRMENLKRIKTLCDSRKIVKHVLSTQILYKMQAINKHRTPRSYLQTKHASSAHI